MKKILLGIMILALVSTAAFAAETATQTVTATVNQVLTLDRIGGASSYTLVLGIGSGTETDPFTLYTQGNVPFNVTASATAWTGENVANVPALHLVQGGSNYILLINGANTPSSPSPIIMTDSDGGTLSTDFRIRANVESFNVKPGTYATTITYTIAAQ